MLVRCQIEIYSVVWLWCAAALVVEQWLLFAELFLALWELALLEEVLSSEYMYT